MIYGCKIGGFRRGLEQKTALILSCKQAGECAVDNDVKN